jgi:hypothetical protein
MSVHYTAAGARVRRFETEWSMRAVTIQLPDDLDEALESYQAAEQDAGDAAAVAERALRKSCPRGASAASRNRHLRRQILSLEPRSVN